MTTISKRDQVTSGLNRLITQWADKPLVQGLLKSYLQSFEELESTYDQLLKERNLETAIGAQLDVLGLIIGEPRGGKDDNAYRLSLKTRIAINNSDGTDAVVTPLLREMTGSDTVKMTEVFPAGVRYELTGSSSLVTSETVETINKIFGATISLEISTSLTGVDFRATDVVSGAGDPLVYSVDYEYQVDNPQGGFWIDTVGSLGMLVEVVAGDAGDWYAFNLNRNIIGFTALSTNVTDTRDALLLLINSQPGFNASAVGGAHINLQELNPPNEFTAEKITDNLTFDDLNVAGTADFRNDHGGIMVDHTSRNYPAQNTNTGVSFADGVNLI